MYYLAIIPKSPAAVVEVAIISPVDGYTSSYFVDGYYNISGTYSNATTVEIFANVNGGGYTSWGNATLDTGTWSLTIAISESDIGTVVYYARATYGSTTVDTAARTINVEYVSNLLYYINPNSGSTITYNTQPTSVDPGFDNVGSWTLGTSSNVTGSQLIFSAPASTSSTFNTASSVITGNVYDANFDIASTTGNLFLYLFSSTVLSAGYAIGTATANRFGMTASAGVTAAINGYSNFTNRSINNLARVAGSINTTLAQSTAAYMPYFRKNFINSLPVLGFGAGGTDLFTSSSNWDLSSQTAVTVFSVLQDTTTSASVIYEHNTSYDTTGFSLYANDTGYSNKLQLRIQGSTGSAIKYSSSVGTLVSPAVVTCVFDISDTANAIRFNGVADTLTKYYGTSTSGTFANAPMQIGARYGGTAPWVGFVGSWIMVAGTMTNAQMLQVERWLGAKFGITVA